MYFAIKYKITLDKTVTDNIFTSQEDCILYVILYHYCQINQLSVQKFSDFISSLTLKIDKDKYWLLAYECLSLEELKEHDIFLHFLKTHSVSFVKIGR
jgi:hypothetical protein